MAAMTRLRPVMMTILSTVLGALPLILGSGPGAEVRTAIGWVVFGGLGIATVFTLVLIPVIYSLLVPLAPSRVHAGIRLYRELCEAELATECRREYRRGKFGKNAATQHRHCKMTLHRSPQDGRDCEEKWTAPAP